MLDGAVCRGRVEPAYGDAASADPDGQSRFYFESGNGGEPSVIEMGSVKAVYLGGNAESEPHAGVRFFDSAPIPSSLWVRIAFADGEVVEGMIANAWSAFSGPLLHLHLPSQAFGYKEVLIPRTSVMKLQVITTR
jgi:hypothetical protein